LLLNPGAQLPVSITNVRVNGGGDTALVGPGSSFTVGMDYAIADERCPGCVDQIQIGFSHGEPLTCIYNGVPGPGGKTGSAEITLTAPNEAGTYYLGFDRSQAYSCPTSWWSGSPDEDRGYFATIRVR